MRNWNSEILHIMSNIIAGMWQIWVLTWVFLIPNFIFSLCYVPFCFEMTSLETRMGPVGRTKEKDTSGELNDPGEMLLFGGVWSVLGV